MDEGACGEGGTAGIIRAVPSPKRAMLTEPPPSAIILAAGLGTRLSPVSGGLPKPLVRVGGRSILDRSLSALVAAGVDDITLVVGHRGSEVVEEGRRLDPRVRVVHNPDPVGSGSMRSLSLAWSAYPPGERPGRVLVVEGDLVYPVRGILGLLGSRESDVVLVSGSTGAGDEVWVMGEGTRIREISKSPSSVHRLLGELVGISLLSAQLMDVMTESHLTGGGGTSMEHYEERISAVASLRPVYAHLEADLPWAEIDDAAMLARAETEILPRLGGRGQEG